MAHQASYAVAPDYFWDVTFRQFGIPLSTPDRLGATITGWRSGSRAGLVLAVPILGASLFASDPARTARAFLAGASAAGLTVLLLGCTALMVAVERGLAWDGAGDVDGFHLVAATQLGVRLGVPVGAVLGTGVALRRALASQRPGVAPPPVVDTDPRHG